MFGIGSTELLVILVVALIVLGPKSLAGVSRSLGRAMGEFRRVSTDFQRTLNAEAAQEEARDKQRKAKAANEKAKEAEAARTDAKDGEETSSAPQTLEKPAPAAPTTVQSPLEEAVARAHAEANGQKRG